SADLDESRTRSASACSDGAGSAAAWNREPAASKAMASCASAFMEIMVPWKDRERVRGGQKICKRIVRAGESSKPQAPSTVAKAMVDGSSIEIPSFKRDDDKAAEGCRTPRRWRALLSAVQIDRPVVR